MNPLKGRFAVCLLGLCAVFSTWGQLTDIDRMTREEQDALIRQYEKDPASVRKDAQLAIAIAYSVRGQFDKAEPLYKEIVAREPRNARAIRGLGNICFFRKQYEVAIEYLEKSWSLGDADSLKPLVFTYESIGRWVDVSPLVPSLLKEKESDPQIVWALMAYAVNSKPPNKEVFQKAAERVTDEQFVARPDDTAKLAAQGFEKFGQPERAAKLRKMISERPQSSQAGPQPKTAE